MRRNGLGRLNRLDPCQLFNRVILLADGQANRWITDPEVLVKHAAEFTEELITITTICYVEYLNYILITALADAGRGNAYHSEAEQCLIFRLCAPAIAEPSSVLLA